jgi:MFS family permease
MLVQILDSKTPMNPTAIPAATDPAIRRSIAFLNVAHGLDHFVLLIYPTVVIGLDVIYHRSYSEMIALSTAAFVAFGLFSLPAGWIADHWSRRNMMATFFFGCGISLLGIAASPNLPVLAGALFALGMFASIYHPVGMAMLIEASKARGRTLAFNGVCGNMGVSLAAGISAGLATWLGWRAAFLVPGVLALAVGAVYVWLTPDDGHHAKHRVSKPAVRLTPRLAVIVFGLFILITLTGGTVFNLLTIALPKIVDERLAQHVPLLLAGAVATLVLVCGGLAQLCVGRLVERFSVQSLFAAITALGFLGNLGAVYTDGIPLMIALAVAIAAIYAQVTVNDILLARYTADAWRGRVYAVRYFMLFISAAAAIGMISFLHPRGGFSLVLAADAAVAFAIFAAATALAILASNIETRQAAQPAE